MCGAFRMGNNGSQVFAEFAQKNCELDEDSSLLRSWGCIFGGQMQQQQGAGQELCHMDMDAALPQRARRRAAVPVCREAAESLSSEPSSGLGAGGLEGEARARLVLEETARVNEWFEAQLAAAGSAQTACGPSPALCGARRRDDSCLHAPAAVREQQADDADEQELSTKCTHFVCIPVDNVSLLHRVATVQEAIVDAEPALRPGVWGVVPWDATSGRGRFALSTGAVLQA